MTIIASQDFNQIGAAASTNPATTTDTLSSGGALTNFGASNTDPAFGLEYTTLWFQTRADALQGPKTPSGDTSDFIGASSFSGSGAPDVNPSGIAYQTSIEYNYEFNDTDGRIELRLAPVDLSDYANRTISLSYWINSTGYEADDAFVITVSDGSQSLDVLAFGEAELEANASTDTATTAWHTLTVDVDALIATGFDADSIQLTLKVDTNASDENIFIDDVQFAGDGEPQSATMVINEIDADQTGTDAAEFIELYDGGAGNTSLDGMVLVLYNGSTDVVYGAYDLDGYSTDANGYFVLGSASVANVDWAAFTTNSLQNGEDAVALYTGDAADFATGTGVTTANLLDAIVYDTSDADDPGLLSLLNAGQPQVDENINGAGTTESLQRIPNGSGGARNTDTYVAAAPTPGEANSAVAQPLAAEIWEVQGSGSASPLAGTTVLIDAIVTGDFQNGDEDATRNLGGFYLQEQTGDGDVTTSDGVFVYEGSASFLTNVNVGDHVQVIGMVQEYYGETQVVATSVSIVEAGAVADVSSLAAVIDLPTVETTVNSDGDVIADLEFVEGMLVTIPETLTVTELYNLDRFGELQASADGRLYQYTNENAPDVAGYAAFLEEIAARTIVIDDGQTVQNPQTIIYPDPALTTANALRMGDTVTGLTGNIRFSRGSGGNGDEVYRLQPTETPTFVAANERTAEPDDVGETATLKVASFNVLNYFTTLGERGAETTEEFARQTEKLVSAITALDADIVGLIELEDNGFGPNSAIATLVDAINTALGETVYGFVDPGTSEVDDDEITVGFIYRLDTVQIASGTTVETLTDADFADLGLSYDEPVFTGENTSRAPMAVTFEEIRGGETLTVVVNHFKSKSGTGSGDNADALDGQGNFNAARVNAAESLAAWLATDPTGSGDSDVLIIGDLNAYLKEDPITVLANAGYDELTEIFGISDAYSYVFDGQAGALDHALSSADLTDQVTGVTEWHINADEADALDYNLNYDRDPTIFDGSVPYRASDHDPAVVGLNLKGDLNLIAGDASDNSLVGTAADDEIQGLAGNDTIEGGDGGDLLIGGEGNDLIVADTLSSATDTGGVEVASELFGGAGNDTLRGGNRGDYMAGNSGDDLLQGGAGDDTLLGGDGIDTASYADADAGVSVSLAIAGVQNTGGAGTDTLAQVENLFGSAYADSLVGDATANVLYGAGGNDTIEGAVGNDTLDGADGSDRLLGGEGSDLYLVDQANDKVIEAAGGGIDSVVSSTDYVLGTQVENLALIEGAASGTGNGMMNLIVGTGADNTLSGLDNLDTLIGAGGSDLLLGGSGNDSLDGGAGNDTLDGGKGRDAMVGGSGDDTYFVDLSSDQTVEVSGGGFDTVISSLGRTLASYIEALELTGTAAIDGSGNGVANLLTGNEAANRLNGLAGNDTLSGGGGDDTLIGSAGLDLLTGGAGADVFAFSGNNNTDTITDFEDGFDKIALNGYGAALDSFEDLRISVVDGSTRIFLSGSVPYAGAIILQGFTDTLTADDFLFG